MTSPSLSLYSDDLFLDELHRRMANGAVHVNLRTSPQAGGGEPFAHLAISTNTGYAFDVMAYPPPVKHI